MGFWIRTAEEKAERGRKKAAAGNKYYNADGSRKGLKESVKDRPGKGVDRWLEARKADEEARWKRVKAEKAAKKGKS